MRWLVSLMFHFWSCRINFLNFRLFTLMLDTLKQRHFLSSTQDNQKFDCVFVCFWSISTAKAVCVYVFKKADFRTARNRPPTANSTSVPQQHHHSRSVPIRRVVNKYHVNASHPFLPASSTNLWWKMAAVNVRVSSKALDAYTSVDFVNFFHGCWIHPSRRWSQF